jgi:hypothetical protein
LTDDNLAWEIMRDHYRTLYLGSPGFRQTVNWRSKTLTEMIHGDNGMWRWSKRYGPKQEAFVRKQHEKGVKAFESFVEGLRRERPALVAEERHRGAEAVPSPLTIEERRMYRDIMWARYNSHRQVRSNWYRKNGLQMEGNA